MPTDITWVGTSTPGDASVAANYSPAQVPVNGDTLYITSGSQSITAGLDQSAVTLALLVVGPGYTGTIGNSAADPYKVGATAVRIQGGAQVFLKGGTFTTLEVNAPSPSVPISIANTITDLILRRGTVTIESGTTTTCNVAAFGGNHANVTLTNKGTITTLYLTAGVVSQSGAGVITTAHTLASTLTINSGTLTNLYCWGATVYLWTTTTVTLAVMFKGTLDSLDDPRTKTITTLKAGYGVNVNLPATVTVTNKYDLAGRALSASYTAN